ncbi:hypothetical protein MTR67_016817, partial [Solanum verrucosum]
TGKLGAKPCCTPIVPNVHLTKDDGDPLDDPERYRKSVGKLNYLIVTRPDIAYARSKKQTVVSRSSAESEYRAMAQSTCEILWIHYLLVEIGLNPLSLAKLWCDNQDALHIASNPVYHERTKHIEVDCHFVHEKIQENMISTGYVNT